MYDPTPVEFGTHRIIKSLNAILASYHNPIENAILIIGEDRANDYGWILEGLSKKTPPIHGVVEALPRPEGAISATEIRGYARDGDWPNFSTKMQSIGLSPSALRELFDQLHEMLTAPAPVTKGKKGKKGGNKRKTKKCSGKRRSRKTKKNYKRRK
jgi:hypothetical protein